MNGLTVDDLAVTFQTENGSVQALRSASFHLDPGGTLVVIGESGSGKTVLAQALMRILPLNAQTTGRVTLGDTSLLDLPEARMQEVRRRRIAWIPQGASSALNPVRRIGSLLLEIAATRGIPRGESENALRDVLAAFDLNFDELARRYPHQLSGGMQQRIVNAAAMLGNPDLVIADEPTFGLDADLVTSTAERLRRVTSQGSALLVITHDLRLAERLRGTLALVYGSYIVEHRSSADFFAGPAHPYGQGLLKALPERGCVPIPGPAPELQHMPSGCPFAPRCAHRMPACEAQVPEMLPVPAKAAHASSGSSVDLAGGGNVAVAVAKSTTLREQGEGRTRCLLYAES